MTVTIIRPRPPFHVIRSDKGLRVNAGGPGLRGLPGADGTPGLPGADGADGAPSFAFAHDPGAGRYLSNSPNGASAYLAQGAATAGAFILTPFVVPFDMNIDQLSVWCTTAVAAALAKIAVYDSDANGRPNAKLFEGADLDLSTTGAKSSTVALTFTRGQIIWLGLRHSSTAAVNGHNSYSMPTIDLGASIAVGAPAKTIRRTLAYASAAPASWSWVATEPSTTVPTAFWLRRA